MPLSNTLTAIATALSSDMGFTWQYGTPYSNDISQRQGRIYSPFISQPRGLEQWQYEVFLNFQTKLQTTSSANLAELGADFMVLLNASIVGACQGLRLRLDAVNGDRHGGLSISNRSNADYITGEVVIIETTNLYKVSHHEPLITL